MEIYSTTIDNIKLDKILLKQLKQLSQICTSECLKIFSGDIAIIIKYNNKVIGMCNIAMVSPEKHFANEINKQVPYLYNYMCSKAHNKKKASVIIMNFIKNLTDINCSELNLDVLVENTHAQKFFEKNNFISCGKYQQGIKEYIKYSFTQD